MGGPVPLGYQVIERKLVPVPGEADRVRTIMQRYIASTSANQLIAELEAEGIRTKAQQRTSGPHKGGIPFMRGGLFHLLANSIYRGEIVHKGKVFVGEHEAIVDEELWNAVQARLQEKAPPRKRKSNDPQEAMLRGLLIAEAMETQELVLASPELSLNQLGKREGRCRTQLGKLFRLSWLSLRIVEAIIDGRQPARLDRRTLLDADLPLCWTEQKRLLGLAA